MSTEIKLTLPDNLALQTKKTVKEKGYSNIQEFALDAIRRLQQEYDSQKNLLFLKNHFQKSKGSYLTKEERIALSKNLLEEDQSEIFRQYNLDKVSDVSKITKISRD